MKQYAVEVLARYSNGRYGKHKYTAWLLSETSKIRACNFAAEIVAGMTWRDLFKESYGDNIPIYLLPSGIKPDEMIGHEKADSFFSYRAFLERG